MKTEQLVQRVEQLRRDVAKAEGLYEAAMSRLSRLGFSTIEEAEAHLDELRESRQTVEAEYKTALSEFESKWGDLLNG